MDSANGEQGSEMRRMKWFFALFVIGFFIIVLGMFFLAASALSSEGSVSFGGFVLIGPFPIVFGAGPSAHWLVLFAIILGVLTVVLSLIFWRNRIKSV